MLVDEEDSSANVADSVGERSAVVEAGPSHIHFSGDSQASQDSSKPFSVAGLLVLLLVLSVVYK